MRSAITSSNMQYIVGSESDVLRREHNVLSNHFIARGTDITLSP